MSEITSKFLRENKALARALHIRPIAIEVRDQTLQVLALHGALERGFIGKFIRRLMQ